MAQIGTSRWAAFWRRGGWWRAGLAVVGYLALYQLAGPGVSTVAGNLIDRADLLATPASVFFGLGAGLIAVMFIRGRVRPDPLER